MRFARGQPEPSSVTQIVFVTMVVAVFAGVVSYATLARYEGVDEPATTVSGTVIGYRTNIDEGSPNSHFVVQLQDGRRINVYDKGLLPKTYRGEVQLLRGAGSVTGKVNYILAAGQQKE